MMHNEQTPTRIHLIGRVRMGIAGERQFSPDPVESLTFISSLSRYGKTGRRHFDERRRESDPEDFVGSISNYTRDDDLSASELGKL